MQKTNFFQNKICSKNNYSKQHFPKTIFFQKYVPIFFWLKTIFFIKITLPQNSIWSKQNFLQTTFAQENICSEKNICSKQPLLRKTFAQKRICSKKHLLKTFAKKNWLKLILLKKELAQTRLAQNNICSKQHLLKTTFAKINIC